MVLLIVGIILAVVVVFGIGIYNGLVKSRNRYKNAFVQIDVQLKRRYDLIPALVETTKGHMAHERNTLEAVIAARNQAFSASQTAAAQPGSRVAMNQLSSAEGTLASSLGRMMAVMESYPDLKAQENTKVLMEELSSTENRIAFARQAFNDSVTEYNNGREAFPAVVLAGTLGFTSAELLQSTLSEAERSAPRVSFT